MQSISDFERTLSEMQIDAEHFGDVETLKQFCIDTITFANRSFDMSYSVSFDMPEGYEDAFGLTRDDTKTVYMNLSGAVESSIPEFIYYFLHEVRHSIQHSCPYMFPPLVKKSLEHAIQYDGTIFYKVNGEWKQYRINGSDDFLAEFYLSSPCEIDANEFALKEVQALFPNESFEGIKKMWFPRYKYFDKNEFAARFSAIIHEIESGG